VSEVFVDPSLTATVLGIEGFQNLAADNAAFGISRESSRGLIACQSVIIMGWPSYRRPP
jgi:hypothetical protein